MELKVSSKSNPNMVAGALAGIIREGKDVCVQAIGAGAVNQAVKGVAIARGMMSTYGHDIVCRPSFRNTFLDGVEKTVMDISIEDCDMGCAQ